MEHLVDNARQTEQKRTSPGRGPGPESAPLHPMLQLQQTAGNQAMQQLLRSGVIRAKLSISQPNDPKEREADSMAGHIMRSHAGAAAAVSHPCSCSEGEEKCDECKQNQATISRKSTASASTSAHLAPSHAVLHQMQRSPGHPLDPSTRAFFEPRFGQDFGSVRVHTDADASQSAAALQAHAYSLGSDIYFGAGKYAPESDAGRHLLAHEMAHTVQQRRGGMTDTASLLRKQNVTVGRADDPMEAEADRVADSVMRSSSDIPVNVSADRSSAVRGGFFGDVWDAVSDAGEWVGEKVEEGGEAVVEGAEAVGHAVKKGAIWVADEAEEGAVAVGGAVKSAGKWALGELENAWDCLMATGHATANLVTGNISSLTDALGIPEPAGEGPSTLNTILAVLKHPCLRMIPGYNLLLSMTGGLERVAKFLDAAWSLIQDPQPVIDAIHASLSGLIAAIPAAVEAAVQQGLAAAGAKAKEQGECVWRHLSPKLDYLSKNWWEVIKETGWTLLWPWPSVGKNFSAIWRHLKAAASDLWHLRINDCVDELLAVLREFNSILGALYGWFAIAAILIPTIAGAIVGGPAGAAVGFGAGFELAGSVGYGLLMAGLAIEGFSLLKAANNLSLEDRSDAEKECDCEVIASSGLSLGIMGVMALLGAIAGRFAKALIQKIGKRMWSLPARRGAGRVATRTRRLAERAGQELPESPKTRGDTAEVRVALAEMVRNFFSRRRVTITDVFSTADNLPGLDFTVDSQIQLRSVTTNNILQDLEALDDAIANGERVEVTINGGRVFQVKSHGQIANLISTINGEIDALGVFQTGNFSRVHSVIVTNPAERVLVEYLQAPLSAADEAALQARAAAANVTLQTVVGGFPPGHPAVIPCDQLPFIVGELGQGVEHSIPGTDSDNSSQPGTTVCDLDNPQ